MLPSLRERLTFLLIALLPFHALLVTVLTKVMEGPGNPPMASIALWKEGLLGIIMLIALIEWGKNGASKKIDRIDGVIVALLLLSIVVTALTHGDWKLYLFGFKYDFIPLVAFLILRRVPWSENFLNHILRLLLVVGSIIAFYGILTFVLPMRWFTFLGYSDMHSLYIPGGPLAAFQQIGGSVLRRIQGTMSGPNQLGIWLLVPLSMVLVEMMRRRFASLRVTGFARLRLWATDGQAGLGILIGLAILLTFSRSAWIAAAVIVAITLWHMLSRRHVLYLASCILLLAAIVGFLFPSIVMRAASTRGHIEKPIAAIQTMIEHPLGLGLGTAGPASNRNSDACVMLGEGDDPSWAASHADLCVFVGDEQVQPLDRSCQCPFVTENWYLQIGVELGVLGFILYVLLIIAVFLRLKQNDAHRMQFFMFLGVSIAALFLHAWEDAAVAYTAWVLLAMVLPSKGSGQLT